MHHALPTHVLFISGSRHTPPIPLSDSSLHLAFSNQRSAFCIYQFCTQKQNPSRCSTATSSHFDLDRTLAIPATYTNDINVCKRITNPHTCVRIAADRTVPRLSRTRPSRLRNRRPAQRPTRSHTLIRYIPECVHSENNGAVTPEHMLTAPNTTSPCYCALRFACIARL